MPLTTAYLITIRNLEEFLNAIRTAKAPERFTQRFLEDLGFASSNDRLYIGLLKSLGFLDENAVPTQRYFDFLDQSQSGAILAQAIREAYADLFAVNTKAHEMSAADVKNKLKTLTRGEKSDKVVTAMAGTFRALSDLADWDAPSPAHSEITRPVGSDVESGVGDVSGSAETTPSVNTSVHTSPVFSAPATSSGMNLHYNIQIHLPESRDPAVYDAIFQSLRKHLM